jgi:hypothetical protein
MGRIHTGEQLVNHTKDGPNRKNSYGNTQYRQGSASFICPQIKPNFVPDNTHSDLRFWIYDFGFTIDD